MVNESNYENINYEWRLILNTKNNRFNNKMSFEVLIDETNSLKKSFK